jgi:hypothetical protein
MRRRWHGGLSTEFRRAADFELELKGYAFGRSVAGHCLSIPLPLGGLDGARLEIVL